ncbi:MAG: M28 family peptidase [Thermoguttaceae bacterium]|nr:M28 family peptidase [Thermoguttaceae bacterium]
MTEEEGNRLLTCCGQSVRLDSVATRIPSFGCNVTGKKGNNPRNRIVITAHIDAKMGTPGAIDNATGMIVLLLLAEYLKDFSFDDKTIELLAINGEDYYAVPGQMAFLNANKNHFDKIALNINIDCAGYDKGKTAVSLFDLPSNLHQSALNLINENDELVEGVPWYQGDHTLFLQNGIPAIVFTSQWFLDNIETQNVTHTPKDTPPIVRWQTLVTIVETIAKILFTIEL